MVITEYPDADYTKLGQQIALNHDGTRLYTSAPGGVAVYDTTGQTLGLKQRPPTHFHNDNTHSPTLLMQTSHPPIFTPTYLSFTHPSPPCRYGAADPVAFYSRNGDTAQANTPISLFFTAGGQFWVAAYSLGASSDVQVHVYRAQSNVKFADFNLYGINVYSTNIVWTVAPGGRRIAGQAARSAGLQIITLNAAGVQATPQVMVPITGGITSLSFSPDGLSLSAVIGSRLYVLNVTSLVARPTDLRGATIVNTALPTPLSAFFPSPPATQSPPPSSAWQTPDARSNAYNLTARNLANWPVDEVLQASRPQFNFGGEFCCLYSLPPVTPLLLLLVGVVGTKLVLQDSGRGVNIWRVSK
ncbi:hypothetical protein QJQ45_024126 [Haematococcus lacustris]|nr:hypothetical protein QJQ45_024126 [Haematococcus lacustris]